MSLDYRQKTFLTNAVSSNSFYISLYAFFLACGIALYLIPATRVLAIGTTEIFVITLSIGLIWRTIGWKPLYLIPVYFLTLVLEMIGANTSLLFGHYDYTSLWKLQVFGTPLAIGLLWILVSICCWCVVLETRSRLGKFLYPVTSCHPFRKGEFVVLGASLATLYDIVLEQVAIKLGYWSWLDNTVPLTNYLCWFVISMITIGYLTRFPLKPGSQKLGVIVFFSTLIYFGILIVVS